MHLDEFCLVGPSLAVRKYNAKLAEGDVCVVAAQVEEVQLVGSVCTALGGRGARLVAAWPAGLAGVTGLMDLSGP